MLYMPPYASLVYSAVHASLGLSGVYSSLVYKEGSLGILLPGVYREIPLRIEPPWALEPLRTVTV